MYVISIWNCFQTTLCSLCSHTWYSCDCKYHSILIQTKNQKKIVLKDLTSRLLLMWLNMMLMWSVLKSKKEKGGKRPCVQCSRDCYSCGWTYRWCGPYWNHSNPLRARLFFSCPCPNSGDSERLDWLDMMSTMSFRGDSYYFVQYSLGSRYEMRFQV